MEEKLVITPKSKVLQVIETYPHLEEVLISHVPAFKKLKNPVLRKTVAKIATLQQAASIGKIKVEDLINLLRKEVGQDLYSGGEESSYNTSKPEWFNESKIVTEFNAITMLDSGEQPVNQVMADLNSLEKGKIYKLIAPFVTAPLIDKATGIGLEHYVVREKDDLFFIYFYK